jgi:hypothetical protein
MKGFKWAAIAACLAAAGAALAQDSSLKIDRSVDSKTLSVSYSGARAALAELRINGRSAATRSLSDTRSTGEATFSLNPASLEDGENEIEVRLYSADGVMLLSEKSAVRVDRSSQGPAKLAGPASGSTVQGPVRIKLEMADELDGSYVSFFVNDSFAALLNRGPYQFTWDSGRAANGWHEIQAVVVDQRNNTFKTQKIRLYVDNAGGRTYRDGTVVIANSIAALSTGAPVTGLKGLSAAPALGQAGAVTAAAASAAVGVPNPAKIEAGSMAGTKPISAPSPAATGTQDIKPSAAVPTSQTFARAGEAVLASRTGGEAQLAGGSGAAPMAIVVITAGKRLPGLGAFNIEMDGRFVDFDVQPRVQNGIPVTPFRHLFEHGGGKVTWGHAAKEISAAGMGRSVWMKVGQVQAKVDGADVELEIAPFIESSRVLVPMSFLTDALDLRVDYDPATGHMLVSRKA